VRLHNISFRFHNRLLEKKMAASKRKPNWSNDELDAPAQAASENLLTIKGKFSPGLSNAQKMKCWESITER
jgi:hypothetical protein